jgi:UDP-glucose 4-epimerase
LNCRKALVTGGAGFIGSHLVDELVTAGYTVRVVDNLSTGNLANVTGHFNSGRADFVKADIRDGAVVDKLVDDVDVVVHLAAITSVPFSMKNPVLTYEVNVGGTRNLLASCARSAVEKFVLVSSCSVYGEPQRLPVDEFHPARPVSPYASSKLEGERCCEAFGETSGFDVVIMRLFNVYGPRQGLSEYSGVITKFLESVRKAWPLTIYGDGSQTRDFVHVSDVMSAVLALLQSDNVTGVFNIGSGKASSINDLAKTVLSILGKDCGIVHQPSRLGDIMHSSANISKAEKAFGYSPKVPLERGIRELMSETRACCS